MSENESVKLVRFFKIEGNLYNCMFSMIVAYFLT